jgi:hypothetical protein
MKRKDAIRSIVGASLTAIAACDSGAPYVQLARGTNAAPTTFGAQVYEVDDVVRSVELIARCGGKCLRVSTQVSPSYLDAIVGAAVARGMRVILLSAYSTQPVDIQAYAAATVAVHRRYASANPIWEIWNEPNLAYYWGGPPNVFEYLRVFRQTAAALRLAGAVDIWTGGTSGVDLNWLYNLVTNGAFLHANGCAVHSYKDPGFARTEYKSAISMMPSGIRIHTTETCVASGHNDQADFFRQMWYLHRELNVPTMVWCELRDGSAGVNNSWPYGLVNTDYQSKVVYDAAQETITNDP